MKTTYPVVGSVVLLVLVVAPSLRVFGGLVAGCDLAASRRLVALCSRARKRSSLQALPVPLEPQPDDTGRDGDADGLYRLERNFQDYTRTGVDMPIEDLREALSDTQWDTDTSADRDSGLTFWTSVRHRARRSTLMQHLVQTCCTQGCSFEKLKEICFG